MPLTPGDEPGDDPTSSLAHDLGATGLDEPLLRELWAWVVVNPPHGERLTALPVGDSLVPMVAPDAAHLQTYRREVIEAVRATGLTHRLLVFGRDEVPAALVPPPALAGRHLWPVTDASSSGDGAGSGAVRGGRTCVEEITPAMVAAADERAQRNREERAAVARLERSLAERRDVRGARPTGLLAP